MTDEELKLLFETLRRETRSDFNDTADRLAAESRHQVRTTIEHVDQRFDLLAESIATLDEKLDRKTSELEERMERGFAEYAGDDQVLPRRA